MRKVHLTLLIILICKVSSFASHIVGGEFEFSHVSENYYRLNLIIYFDEINGNQGAKYSPTPVAWIYRKSDNQAMTSITLPYQTESKVQYSQPACQNDAVVNTTRMVFSSLVSLNMDSYADPQGYYIVWQRCCRNYTIQNIVSENPDTGGIGSGQTFYLEIPPLKKNGQRFVNNSPQLFPPLSDYACINRSFYADFGGTDVDGDSLAYEIVTPLNTPSATPHPQPPSKAPYPGVQWEGGYSLNDILHGNPDLTIDKNGRLKVTPTEVGLFVFAVKCSEYRNGQKIGEVRRDFQMVVVDCQDAGVPPQLQVQLKDGSTYQEGQVLYFDADNQSKCVDFTVKDNSGKQVDFDVEPVGYEEDNFTFNILSTSPSKDEVKVEVCFTDCPPEGDLPFKVSFIGKDNTCPQPLQDTLTMTIQITPPDNNVPVLEHKEDIDSDYDNASEREVVVTEKSGGLKIVELLGRDADNEMMSIDYEPVGFDMSEYGMSVVSQRNASGTIEEWLQWNYDCQQISFDGKTEFEIKIYLEDEDQCEYDDPAELLLKLKVILPPNTEPEINSDELPDVDHYYYKEIALDESFSFDLDGEDLDGDLITLFAEGVDFDFSDYSIGFNSVTDQGGSQSSEVHTRFNWDFQCDDFNLVERDSLRVYFMVEDFDKCEITNADTITVDFKLVPPPNEAPVLFAHVGAEQVLESDSLSVIVGDEVVVKLTGNDNDGDLINLSLSSEFKDALGYSFEAVEGFGTVQSIFSWVPDCSSLEGAASKTYDLPFLLSDRPCATPDLTDTLWLKVHVKDIDNREELFIPPNIFTPNKDTHNEFFGMYSLDTETGELQNILPIDNCAGSFEKVVILNRWGKEVYESDDRDFKWYGEDMPAGIYYYYIQYSNRKYRGSLTLIF